MKKYIFSTEISQKDLDNYKVKMADYLKSLYQLNDISELSERELVESFKNDMYNAASEFDRTFHYHIDKPALVCREKEDGLLVIDVCKNDINKTTEMCIGKKQEFYIEDGEFRFDGTSCGEMLVRFAKDDCIFRSGDFIANEDVDTFTEPVGDWLDNKINLWNKEMTR